MNESKGILAQTQAGGDGLCGLRAGEESYDSDDKMLLLQARYVLKGLNVERPGCGYAKMAAALERVALSTPTPPPRTIASDGLRMPPSPSAGEVNAEMLEALKDCEAWIVDLAESGDAGYWDASLCPEVIAARAAISRAEACAPEDGWKS